MHVNHTCSSDERRGENDLDDEEEAERKSDVELSSAVTALQPFAVDWIRKSLQRTYVDH